MRVNCTQYSMSNFSWAKNSVAESTLVLPALEVSLAGEPPLFQSWYILPVLDLPDLDCRVKTCKKAWLYTTGVIFQLGGFLFCLGK